jgi:ADP-ribose pyrophosphatase YjhB (NUDIX family)
MSRDALEHKAQAAVAIVRAQAPQESILLIRRSEHPLDPWSGHWSFPGGRCDADDEDLLHTALRELEEECGVRLLRQSLRATLAPVVARRRTPPYMLVAPFEFAVESELATVLDPEEAVEAVWMPLRRWRDPAEHALRPVPGMPSHFLFPAIELNGVPLWGFTYRLTADWLGLLPTEDAMEEAGFAMARAVLAYLASSLGLAVKSGWAERVATVDGPIPLERVAAWLAVPAAGFPTVSMVELRPELIRILGLAFEEYLIRAI